MTTNIIEFGRIYKEDLAQTNLPQTVVLADGQPMLMHPLLNADGCVPTASGGLAQDASAKTGSVIFYNGAAFWNSGEVLLDAFGAVGDGTTDDSAAIQAAFDSGAQRIVGNPAKTYYVATRVDLDHLGDDIGREFDGKGCTIKGGGGIVNAIRLPQPTNTDGYNNLKFHDVRFSGTVSGSFVKFEAGKAQRNAFWNLWTATDGLATAHALLEIQNVSASNNPGGLVVRNVFAPSNTVNHTVLFSKAAGALADVDDAHLDWIQGGNDSTIYIENGIDFVRGHIHDVLSSGHGIDTTAGGTVQHCDIRRFYLEPISGISHYAIAGNFYDCTIDTLDGWISDYTAMTDVRMAYGTFYDCTFRNISLEAGAHGSVGDADYFAGGKIYASYSYPIIVITAGARNRIDFEPEYAQYGISITAGVWPLVFDRGPIPFIQNQDITISNEWWLADTLWTNYNQSAESTITLPAAKANMRVRVVLTATGNAYHIKAGAGDKIILNGTALDDGDKMSCATPALGNTAELYTFRSGVSGSAWTYDWIATTSGTWTDGGA